jgi:hypothetical protein
MGIFPVIILNPAGATISLDLAFSDSLPELFMSLDPIQSWFQHCINFSTLFMENVLGCGHIGTIKPIVNFIELLTELFNFGSRQVLFVCSFQFLFRCIDMRLKFIFKFVDLLRGVVIIVHDLLLFRHICKLLLSKATMQKLLDVKFVQNMWF